MDILGAKISKNPSCFHDSHYTFDVDIYKLKRLESGRLFWHYQGSYHPFSLREAKLHIASYGFVYLKRKKKCNDWFYFKDGDL